MQVIADFHIHSRYSRATSSEMGIEEISRNGRLKGLQLVGTGDFTHPSWLDEIRAKIGRNETQAGSGVFEHSGMLWMLTSEVATIYTQDGRTRKVHHVLHAPSIEVVEQINEALGKYGRLASDGRPMLSGITSPALVELLMQISKDILVYPAHAWTSWFGVVGEFSGFDSLEQCYLDQTKNVHALETGMSSDPAMNWRVPSMDRFTILSNSDSHSPWPWRIGREANVFDIGESRLSYAEINDAIVSKDPKRLKFTIEVDPSYGKYHFTGHRACGVSMGPEDARKVGNVCPVCGRKMTVGVAQRVEDVAGRPEGFVPEGAIPFKSLIPLYEIISAALGVNQLYSKRVIGQQDALIARFGSELDVLLNAPEEDMHAATEAKIADAIMRIRKGDVKYVPGYDGVYGAPVFSEEDYERARAKLAGKANKQRSLSDFRVA
ncbi:MAG: endonuclease Q family protein [Candidatus Aenigmatarchaeota archaeon]